jgi:hypothetical protein
MESKLPNNFQLGMKKRRVRRKGEIRRRKREEEGRRLEK